MLYLGHMTNSIIFRNNHLPRSLPPLASTKPALYHFRYLGECSFPHVELRSLIQLHCTCTLANNLSQIKLQFNGTVILRLEDWTVLHLASDRCFKRSLL